MAVSFEQYCTDCADVGLLTADEIAEAKSAHPTQDVQGLARWLVRREKLTAFQAQQAYAGRAKTLVLGNYVVLDKLGQGGMGAVYKARHKVMKRVVALKVLSPDLTKTDEAVQRFQREVEAAAHLEHPNIIVAHDADCVGKTHFLVMQYVDGSDLSHLVKEKGPLPVDKGVNVILQAARGLEYAHGRGIVHRDIKPANLLLDREGVLKILDMGLARFSGGAARDELTHSGAVMGTVDYMSPEQALSTRNADARSDIYSLGLALWYVLTGRVAYEGDSMMAKLLAHRETTVPSLKGARAEVPAALDAVFRKMVAKKPEQRFQTMTEVITALEGALVGDAKAPSVVKKRTEESRFSELLGGGAKADSGLDFLAEAVAAAPAKSKTATAARSERTLSGGESFQSTDPLLARNTRGGKRGKRRANGFAAWWAKNQLWAIGAGGAVLVVGLAIALSPSSPSAPPVTQVSPPETITVTRGEESKPAPSLNRDPVDNQVLDLLLASDLKDWEQFGGAPDSWSMTGGMLIGRGPLNRLVYRPRKFTDFDLRAEVRLSAGANSGVYLRCDLSAETYNGYEIQFGQVGIPSTRDTATGGIYGRAPYQQRIVGDNEWMVVGASVRGQRISVSVNGQQTVDYTDPNNSFPSGFIGVQGHHPGMKVEFRQLQVLPVETGTPVTTPAEIVAGLRSRPGPASESTPAVITTNTPTTTSPATNTPATNTPTATAPADAGWTDLFNGKDLTGWTVTGAPSWGVQGGVLKVTGTERGYLFTDKKFSDFELEIEFRVPPRGNSGLLFWVPSMAQFDIKNKLEVQICDDFGAPGGEQRPDRLTGAIYNGVARVPQAAAIRPDVWHTLRIRVEDKRIDVSVNGTRYLNSYLPQSSLPPGLLPDVNTGNGHLGLMAWSSAVEFRSVRVKELKPGHGGTATKRSGL
jgi:serine/threonine protein kinase